LTKSIQHILKENQRRLDFLFAPYDPVFGINSLVPRFEFFMWKDQKKPIYLPIPMLELPVVKLIKENFKSAEDYCTESGYNKKQFEQFVIGFWKERMRHDYEFFAHECQKVEDKITKQPIKFRLRYAQRRIVAELERQRTAGKPIRINIPKSRQFGSSTLIQSYMFWMQNIVKENWHSATVAHLDDAAKNLRTYYEYSCKHYPEEIGKVTLVPHAKSSKNQKVKETGSIVGVGSSQTPDNLRGYSFSMLHISELAFFVSTPKNNPKDLAQSLSSTVPLEKNTLIVRESTCKGVGGYWHQVCMSSVDNKSNEGYQLIFIPFFEIEIYHQDIAEDEIESFINGMSEYDWFLWEQGATLQSIKWYNAFMTTEEYDEWRMKSEYPSNFLEAFQSSGQRVFPEPYVLNTRKTVKDPIWKGELHGESHIGPESLQNLEFQKNDKGNLWIWSMPEKFDDVEYTNRYCVSMDIGGASEGADYSVIRVMDRFWMMDGGIPEIVATWRGKIDQDILAWKAVQIAKMYGNALFITESNSLRRSKNDNTEGSHFLTILDQIVPYYHNIYCRTNLEQIRQGVPRQFGFHTGETSKTMVINCLKAAMREFHYIERDKRACDEFDMYEYKPDGTMGNVDGASSDLSHDDIVMSTAILVWCSTQHMPPVQEVELKPVTLRKSANNIASF
jgi:hypothetical protein